MTQEQQFDIQPQEIERAVVTILSMAQIENDLLRQWVHHLLENPYHEVSLTEYYNGLSDEEKTTFRESEWVRPGLAGQMDLSFPARYRDRKRPGTRVHMFLDESLAKLADALVSYRIEGRPTGDTTSEIHSISGGVLTTVTSSLAARVAEYVAEIQNHWAGVALRLEDQLRQARS